MIAINFCLFLTEKRFNSERVGIAGVMPRKSSLKNRERPKSLKGGSAEAEKWLRESLLARALSERSYLDEKTLKTMLLHYWSEKATFEELAKKLNIQRPGAWKRLQKGRDAVMRSFYTLELAVYAGILDVETAELMADDLLDYVSLARGEGDMDELRDRIERRMVQLAKKTSARS